MSTVVTKTNKIRIYRVTEGDLERGTELKLEMVRQVESMGEARGWLKSKECLLEQLRDRHTTEAQFIIIPEKDHYKLMPVTVILSQTLADKSASPGDVVRGMRIKEDQAS